MVLRYNGSAFCMGSMRSLDLKTQVRDNIYKYVSVEYNYNQWITCDIVYQHGIVWIVIVLDVKMQSSN